MTLREKQSKFAIMVALLIQYIYSNGYEVTFGDAARMDKRGHMPNSKHYKRLAIDLNLFKNGRYLRKTVDHLKFGVFWENIGGTWGGRFKNPDGNHYQL
jgi:hypothetical protein